MPRPAPLDSPDPDAVAALVESELSTAVESVRPFEEGLNAVYRVETRFDTLVCKAATFATDEELRVEAALTDHLDRETSVPVPAVRSTVDPSAGATDAGGVDVARLIVDHVDGRNVAGVLDLSPAERERLVVESGRLLAAVHDAAPVEAVGRLAVEGAAAATEGGPPAAVVDDEPWSALFDSLVSETLAGLRGEGYTTGDGAFADLVGPIEAALSGGPGVARTVDPALLLTDYRPANLVLAADWPSSADPVPDADPDGAETTSDPLVAAPIDVGHGPVGDGLLDLALTECTLVDLPLGGVAPDAAARLRDRLRGAYRERRSTAVGPGAFAPGGRYDRYRLYAAARRLTAVDYWKQFAGDGSGAADRLRSSVRELAARLR